MGYEIWIVREGGKGMEWLERYGRWIEGGKRGRRGYTRTKWLRVLGCSFGGVVHGALGRAGRRIGGEGGDGLVVGLRGWM